MLLASSPGLHRDFISQLGEQHDCEIKSGQRPGNEATVLPLCVNIVVTTVTINVPTACPSSHHSHNCPWSQLTNVLSLLRLRGSMCTVQLCNARQCLTIVLSSADTITSAAIDAWFTSHYGLSSIHQPHNM